MSPDLLKKRTKTLSILVLLVLLSQIIPFAYYICFITLIIFSNVFIRKNTQKLNLISSKLLFFLLLVGIIILISGYYMIDIRNQIYSVYKYINIMYLIISVVLITIFSKKFSNHSKTLYVLINTIIFILMLCSQTQYINLIPIISLFPTLKYCKSKINKNKLHDYSILLFYTLYLIGTIVIIYQSYNKLNFQITINSITMLIGLLSIYYTYDINLAWVRNALEKFFPKRIIPKKDEIKKVTAVIPNYNYAHYMKARVDSILNQNYPIYELIILDDKSTDNSIEVINKLIPYIKKKRPNIKVEFIINKENSGNVFKQWEKAFEVYTGDYLWICEADDLCSKYFLNMVMKGFNDESVVLSYSESKAINENNVVFKKDLRDWIDIFKTGHWNNNYIESGKHELKYFLSMNNTIANVSGVVFKRNNKIDYRSYLRNSQNFVLAGDWYFYSKVLLYGKIAYNALSLNYHRIHSSSVTQTTDNFIHYKEIKYVQNSISSDIKIPRPMQQRIKMRNEKVIKDLCISEDELKYDKISLKDLIKQKNIKDEVLLSIVIPVYNVEKYLNKCLKSVFKNLPIKTEVIIINDGSPDNSEKIIKTFEKAYNNIKYIKKENGGLSSVKNLGLSIAKGKYIIFLDSDDYVSSNMYDTMLKKIIDTDSDLVYCDVLMTYEDGSVKYVTMKNSNRKDTLMQIIDGNLMAASWNKMVKRELYEGLKFPEKLNNEDIAVSPLLILKCKKIEYINSPFYKYVQRYGSIQNSGFNEKRFVVFKTAKICFDAIKNYDYITREKVIGAIVTHQLLAILIYLIFPISDTNERQKFIKMFCQEFRNLNLDLTSNQYVAEYLHMHNLDNLIYAIENDKL